LNLAGYQLNQSVNRSKRPVNLSEPVEHAILNLTGPVGLSNPAF
jgi:hypothetical protein